jgi:hypothetical protein
MHGSWLNLELRVLKRQCPRRQVANRSDMGWEVTARAERRNSAATIAWQFTTADARTRLRWLYPAVED